MKKLLSLFLAVIMVMAIAVAAIPTTIFAAGNTSSGAADANFRIGDQYYSTLKAALEDAKDGDTIDMLKNVDDPTTEQLGTYSKNLTINGNGFTYTALKNTNKYLFYVNAGKTITINRMNMIVQSGIGISGDGGVFNLNDCTITSTYRMAIRTSGAKKAEFNLHNTVLTGDSYLVVNGTRVNGEVSEPLVYTDATDYTIINLTGTSKLVRRNRTQGDIGNCSVINVVSNAGYVEINVGSQSEIVLNHNTGNANGPQGIKAGGKGVVNLRLAEGAIIRVDSDVEASPYIFHTSHSAGGVSVVDNGGYILVKSSRTNQKPVSYLSPYETYQQVDTVVESGYTTFKFAAPVEADTAKTIRYYDGGVKYTNDFKAAASAADDGTTIYFLNDFTQKSANGMLNTTNRVSVVGNGYTVNFNNNTAGGTFPIMFKANMALVNFEKIATSTGGLQGYSGCAIVADGVYESGNRAAFKMSGGSGTTCEVFVRNAEICTNKAVGATEAVVILEGAGKSILTLQENAILRKNNPYNTAYGTQASVIYTANSGDHTINMESGSKIVSNAVSGNATGDIIAHTAGAKLALNMEQGAYLVSDSTALSTLYFFYTTTSSKFKLNAPADAYLVTAGKSITLKDYTESSQYGSHVGTFAKKGTSDVAGYDQYTLTTPVNDEFFVFTNVFGDEVPLTFAQAVDLPGTNTVKLRADRTFSDSSKGITESRNLTIDLNGYTLTNTASSYVFSVIDGVLTIKNGTFNLKRGLVTTKTGSNRSGELNLINMKGDASERPYIKISSGAPVVNIQDSTITSSANGENVILVENAATGTINVTGNSYVAHKGGSAGGTNCSVVMIAGTSSVKINVGAGATMSSAYQIKDTQWGGVIVSASKNTDVNSVVTLEAGAKLAIERVNGAGGEAYFTRTRTDATHIIDVVDKGATYTVNEAISKDGFYLPANVYTANGAPANLGFRGSDGNVYKGGIKVKVAAADGTMTFQLFAPSVEELGLVPGASLRTVKGELGIRFTGYFSDSLKEMLGADARFGIVIAPGKTTADDPTANLSAIDVRSTKSLEDVTIGDETYDNTFNVAVIYPIDGETADVATKANMYGLSLVARAYVEIVYSDGTSTRFYTDITDNNVRSMATVAENLDAKGESNSVIVDILTTMAEVSANADKYYDSIVKDGVSLYTVVYPEGASEAVIAAANKIAAKLGVTAAVAGTYNADAYEIVVGNVSYTETTTVKNMLGYYEGIAKVVGNKIVVVGADDELVGLAADKLVAFLDRYTLSSGDVVITSNYEGHVTTNALFSSIPKTGESSFNPVDTGDDCYMINFSSSSTFNNYKAALEQKGFELYASNTIESNTFYTYVKDDTVVNLMKTKKISNGKILVENISNTELPTRAEDNVYTSLGITSTITQIGLWYDNGSTPRLQDDGNYNYYNGMSYVIRLDDGSFIIIDGGTTKVNAEHLYSVLCEQAPDAENIVIAAWIFTHGHNDHVGAFQSFASLYSSKVTVERFIYNFPASTQAAYDASNGSQGAAQGAMDKYFPNTPQVKAHAGQVFNIRNAKITMYFNYDIYTGSDTSFNITSLVFRVEVAGKSFMVLGDIYDDDNMTVMANYTKTSLKSDITHVAHHGISGMPSGTIEMYRYKAPYEAIGASYVFWPIGALQMKTDGESRDYWNKDMNKYIKSNYTVDSTVFIAEDNVFVMTLGDTISVAKYDTVDAYVNS